MAMVITDVWKTAPYMALLLLAGTFAAIAYATMKIYAASVLYYGQRLRLRDLVKIKL